MSGFVGKLQCAAAMFRPDIAQPTTRCCRYITQPLWQVYRCALRILAYFGRTPELGITIGGAIHHNLVYVSWAPGLTGNDGVAPKMERWANSSHERSVCRLRALPMRRWRQLQLQWRKALSYEGSRRRLVSHSCRRRCTLPAVHVANDASLWPKRQFVKLRAKLTNAISQGHGVHAQPEAPR